VPTPTPRLSWRLLSAPDDFVQQSYEVEITRHDGVTTWPVASNEQILVEWPAPALQSRERASIRVRVCGAGSWSPWSDNAVVEAGLLVAGDWSAKFISPIGIGGLRQAAPELRGTLELPTGILRARLYSTAHGIYTPRLNGHKIDDTVLAPGWTAYEQRLRYRTYDVTTLLQEGVNHLDVVLGNGWWRGRFGFFGERAIYGDRLALLAQLEVTTQDGTVLVLATDNTWQARPIGIVADDIYDGQTTDLRFDADSIFATPVEVIDADLSRLVAEDGPPMRIVDEVPATRVWTSPSGRTLIDFGQNIVGWVRLRIGGAKPGTEIVLRHAEVLENGELGVGPLRSARATDTYLTSGADEEVLEPSLTFHGFRFAEISAPVEVSIRNVTGVVIASDLDRTGWFSSSDELLDRFHENVVWGMRGNFLDVPTDCPQRDERLGWTGDIQVFAPTATYLFNSSGFLTSWLADLAAEQGDDGSVPHVVPDILRTELSTAPAAAWGDAATIVPWTLWQRTRDRGILVRQFDSMRAWVDRVHSLAGVDLVWRGGFQYGDWLDPSAPHDDAAAAKADPDVVATAHFARSASIVAQAASIIGVHEDAERYSRLAADVRASFRRAFVTADGRIMSDAQTVYALALEWDLIEDAAQREWAGRRLADLVRASDFRIATGFVGTPIICDALMNAGHADTAFRLLFQTGAPSWLYPVTMGATTVWERWDSLLPDGSINPSGMTSFNHYALGSIIDWIHRRIAGLAPASPGYKTISVRPVPPRQLEFAKARHMTPFGEAAVSWSRSNGTFTLDVRVPVGVRASIELPWADVSETVGHGDHRWTVSEPLAVTSDTSTIRGLVDDEATWHAFTQLAIQHNLGTNKPRIAHLLSSIFDRSVDELPSCVWSKAWPTKTASRAIADFVARLHDTSTGTLCPVISPSEETDALAGIEGA
jgi:alpha-L-rhamnosidase